MRKLAAWIQKGTIIDLRKGTQIFCRYTPEFGLAF